MVWAKRGHALGHGSAGDLAPTHHIFEAEPSPSEPLWAIREPRLSSPKSSPHQVFALSRRQQRRIYLLVEADAGDQDLVSAELGDLPGDGL
jgi:hypothetical protein